MCKHAQLAAKSASRLQRVEADRAAQKKDSGFDPRLCKNSTRYNRTQNFGHYRHAESKKTQKFVFRSALRPNQISFSHSQDPKAAVSRAEIPPCNEPLTRSSTIRYAVTVAKGSGCNLLN
jgi:hypothetical protein